jgi:hypothetical protein
MDFLTTPAEVMSFASTLLLLLLNADRALDLPAPEQIDEDCGNDFSSIGNEFLQAGFDVDAVTRAAL